MITQDQFPFGGMPEPEKKGHLNSLLYLVLALSIMAGLIILISNTLKKHREEQERNNNNLS